MSHKGCFDYCLFCVHFDSKQTLPAGVTGAFDPCELCEDARYFVKKGEGSNNEDPMINPNHYKRGGMEVIDVIKAFTSNLKGIEATDTGNIIKYICRWKEKNGLQDLKKAKWYLDHLIDEVDKKEE